MRLLIEPAIFGMLSLTQTSASTGFNLPRFPLFHHQCSRAMVCNTHVRRIYCGTPMVAGLCRSTCLRGSLHGRLARAIRSPPKGRPDRIVPAKRRASCLPTGRDIFGFENPLMCYSSLLPRVYMNSSSRGDERPF